MKCKYCGNELSDRAVMCPRCGEPIQPLTDNNKGMVDLGGKKVRFLSSKKDKFVYDKTYLICAIFFGIIAYFIAVVKENEEGKKGAAVGIIINYIIAVVVSVILLAKKYLL